MERLVTKTAAADWPNVGLNEYLLVANPDVKVVNKLMQEKLNFCAEYGQKTSIETNNFITIASFVAREEMEETIFRYMQRILMKQETFEVELNNYSGFPPHSVYLRVQNSERFRQLGKDLKAVDDYINSCFCPPLKLVTKPHVSIADQLPEALYHKAIMAYSQKSFHETFVINELMLLKRSNDYEIKKRVNVFKLRPSGNSLYN